MNNFQNRQHCRHFTVFVFLTIFEMVMVSLEFVALFVYAIFSRAFLNFEKYQRFKEISEKSKKIYKAFWNLLKVRRILKGTSNALQKNLNTS